MQRNRISQSTTRENLHWFKRKKFKIVVALRGLNSTSISASELIKTQIKTCNMSYRFSSFRMHRNQPAAATTIAAKQHICKKIRLEYRTKAIKGPTKPRYQQHYRYTLV